MDPHHVSQEKGALKPIEFYKYELMMDIIWIWISMDFLGADLDGFGS
jgi:hypothetical protein